MTAVLSTYRVLTSLATPALTWWLRRRADKGKEDPARLDERFGRTALPRPEGPLVWLHGASLGESGVVRELISVIREQRPDARMLVTTQTVSAASVWAADLPERTVHQFIPADTPAAAKRFVAHWRPDLAIFVESEIWPNLLYELECSDIPCALVNARMNARSVARWSRRSQTAQTVFGTFELVTAADLATADALSDWRDYPVPVLPNLKFAIHPRPDADAVTDLRSAFATSPIVCVASLHGEEMALADWLKDFARIIVPRHPEDIISTDMERRSRDALPQPGSSAYLFDTFGEMAVALAAADIVVMGGSFHPDLKGHNPVEALRLRKPVISGPHVDSFRELYQAYWDTTGTGTVKVKDLPGAVAEAEWTPAHEAFLSTLDGARDAIGNALAPLLERALP